MSALRLSTPDGIRLVDLGPTVHVPLRGASLRGSMAVPQPTITPELREKWRQDAERQRAKRRAAL